MVHIVNSGLKRVSAGEGEVRTTRQQILAVRNNAANDTPVVLFSF